MTADRASYKDQSANDLRLELIDGLLDVRQFAVLQSGGICHPRVAIRARIIGASHVVEMRARGHHLHEVFACGNVVADARRFVSAGVTEIREPLELELGPGVDYAFRARAEAQDRAQPVLRRLRARATAAARRPMELGLDYRFPGTGGAAPRTLVWVGAGGDRRGAVRVRIETAHSYPNERTIVFSTTRLSIAPGGGA